MYRLQFWNIRPDRITVSVYMMMTGIRFRQVPLFYIFGGRSFTGLFR
jgi:hypothetical protein